ncbi:hypothetical protein ACRTDR_19245 [Shewanella algae]|uniref:Uncharacterized protein n=1 Tax=Shewanella carassii TaxID=1987584 RepID=A0ABQ1SW76_9GAMM|nr:hypothetical protein GCM10011520_05890 [Shewanella carassii]
MLLDVKLKLTKKQHCFGASPGEFCYGCILSEQVALEFAELDFGGFVLTD